MSILGIGVDMVALARIQAVCERRAEQFARRVFTETERAYFEPEPDIPRIAARFAVKEAVSKALGTGIGKVGWQDIETTRSAAGAPQVQLYGRAAELAREKGVQTVHCSISHERTMAVAMIILEG
ncbi:MAG: holo-ACP synthase [Peptococcaceae bacterium]|nr:holo-ACP synthase [Peptococcaceae bacterium]